MRRFGRPHNAVPALFFVLCGILLCSLPGCGGTDRSAYIGGQIGISLPRGVSIKYTDSHGGFHGDGDLYAIVSFPDDETAARFSDGIEKAGWQTALSDEMYPWFYGGDVTIEGKASSTDGYFHDMGLDVPAVKDGYFFYRDRYLEQYGEACSFAPYTQNFTIAIFDADTDKLYFIEGDS